MFGDNTAGNNKYHSPSIDRMTLVYVQLPPPSAQSSYNDKTDCKLEKCWGIRLMLKHLQKQLHRRRRQWCFKIDPRIIFWGAVISLLISTGSNALALFLVHQVLCTSARVWQYCQVFTSFSLCILSACPIISVVR